MPRVEAIEDQGHPAWAISLPDWTWVFHQEGGAVAHLYDAEDRDWVAWSPEPEAAGAFRGLGNLVHVDLETGFFHPGNRGSNGCRSRILTRDAGQVLIRSVSADGAWAVETAFRPEGCCIRMTDTPARPWWFLYEGTPGGVWSPAQCRWLRSDGPEGTLQDPWQADLPDRSWVAFTDAEGARALVLWQEKGERRPDQYFPMEPMTVFGFGRHPDNLEKHCHRTGQAFLAVPVNDVGRAGIQAGVDRAVAAFGL
jgi:hypothetical protein